jgi:carbon storage regulator
MRRRAGDAILIGDDIQIEVIEVSPNRVKLGIVAPAHLAVTRKEVVSTRQQNVAASQYVSSNNLSRILNQLVVD